MADLRFQLATTSDNELLLKMMQEFYQHEEITFDAANARQALHGILSNEAFGKVFLLFVNEMVAGYAVLTFGYSLEFCGRDAFVDELFLHEQFRGQGLGKQVLEFLAKVCVEHGIRALHLEVEHKNTIAQQSYRKFGFADHDRHLMTKWLDAN
ncbi:MAG TPA: GNAT family N-acetyltransferase [Blastocatellia bacterium]|nr:GNAT family N-acetyltransferase [Blastocatellia bacterium]